jgi:hypothetical protein
VPGGTDAHIGEEEFELGPSIAAGYAASSVPLPSDDVWIVAAVSHGGPTVIGRGFGVSVGAAVTVSEACCFQAWGFDGSAAAGFDFFSDELVLADEILASAVALAEPEGASVFVSM